MLFLWNENQSVAMQMFNYQQDTWDHQRELYKYCFQLISFTIFARFHRIFQLFSKL